MNVFLRVVGRVMFVFSLSAASLVSAGADTRVLIPVYKGNLEIYVLEHTPRSVLRIRFYSRTRDVLRIAINDPVLMHMATGDVIRLRPRMADLSSRVNRAGYWVAEIAYGDLDLIDNDYRLSGRLEQYLANAQRSRRFEVYLGAQSLSRPPGSSIDWGVQQ
jgi:hypothetical protein